MTTATITGQDTLTLFGRNIVDLASGKVSSVTFNNDRANMKTGKNKNTVYARNSTGDNAEMVLRLNRGSSDDQFLEQLKSQSDADFAATVLAAGQFVKRIGKGDGTTNSDVYTLQGGIFMRNVDAEGDSDGDIEQGISTYRLGFAYSVRSIQ